MSRPFRRPVSRIAAVAACVYLSVAVHAQTRPPADPKATRKADLVELVTLDPGIRLDIRYAKSNNFLGKPVPRGARSCSARPPRRCSRRIEPSRRTATGCSSTTVTGRGRSPSCSGT
ncbi:MAG: hypothetical protein R2708_12705 [Vicinamibacterales bacterium]